MKHKLTALHILDRTPPARPGRPGSDAGSSPDAQRRRRGRRGPASDTSSLDGRRDSTGHSQARRPAPERGLWCSPNRPDAHWGAAESGPRARPAAAEGASGARGASPGGAGAGGMGARDDTGEQAARRERMRCQRALTDGLAELMARLDALKREKEMADEASEMLASQAQARPAC